jgi:hypothetical protein
MKMPFQVRIFLRPETKANYGQYFGGNIMQTTTLSMSGASFEASAYFRRADSKENSETRNGSNSAPKTQEEKPDGERTSVSLFVLDIAGIKAGLEDLKLWSEDESFQSGSLSSKSFRMKIQYITVEAFSEQSREHERVTEAGFSFSYTSVEISFSSSEKETGDIYDKYFGENAYWGAEQTSERIFEFIKAISGGSQERLEQAKTGAVKGYKSVEKDLGKMPQVCMDTMDLLMEKIEAYKEVLSAQQPVDLTA